MTLPDGSTPGTPERVVHLALFVGHFELLHGQKITYTLGFYCRETPGPRLVCTTAKADVTCPECLQRVDAVRQELAVTLGFELPADPGESPRQLN